MPDKPITRRSARDTIAQLNRLGHHELLEAADRKVCLIACEWLSDYHDLQSRLENAEAYLNDEVHRHETTLANLSRRSSKPHGPLHGAELLAYLRRLKHELEDSLPASPRSRPFPVGAA